MYARTKPKKKPKTVSTLPIPEYLTVLDIPLLIINITKIRQSSEKYYTKRYNILQTCNTHITQLRQQNEYLIININN